MEENDQHKDDHKEGADAPVPPKPSGVMDIQRPKPHNPDPKPAVSDHPVQSGPPSIIEVSEGGEIKPAANFESEHKTPEVIQHHIEEEHKKEEQHQQQAAKGKHRSGKPVLVILLAVVIALSLAGVAVYAYMQSNDTASPNTSKTENTQPATPATTTDVDDATKDVDDAISSVDDTQDLPESDLTDQTLGL